MAVRIQEITDAGLIDREGICIPRGAARDYLITVTENCIDGALNVVNQRTDLTSSEIRAAVKRKSTDSDALVVFQKSSANGPAEIEILPQVNTVPDPDEDFATKGQFVLKILGTDTEDLDPDACFVFDIWVLLPDGRRDAVIDESAFKIIQRITPITVAAPPLGPVGDPATQSPQERSFLHTVAVTATVITVTIPLGELMRDTSYGVWWAFNTLVGAHVPIEEIREADKTTATFIVRTGGGAITAGTTIEFHLRDRT